MLRVTESSISKLVQQLTKSTMFTAMYRQKNKRKITFEKGDVVINTQQPDVKYLLETLEPMVQIRFSIGISLTLYFK